MTRRILLLFLLALGLAGAAIAQAPAPDAPARKPVRFIGDRPETSSYWIPGSTVLAKVDKKALTARDFIETYYNAYAPDRPETDSLGRVEWLNSMVNKEVLGNLARSLNYPLDFEQRAALREHTERTLSNELYQRLVVDSVRVSEEAVRALHAQLNEEQHLREILCADRPTAEAARTALVTVKMPWKQAFARYSLPTGASEDGDLGWLNRIAIGPAIAPGVVGLAAGQISPVVSDNDGYHVVQCVERRKVDPPPLEGVRSILTSYVAGVETMKRIERLQNQMRTAYAVTYDSATIAWAAPQFRAPRSSTPTATGVTKVRFTNILPNFSPADTGRVVARYRDGGVLTLRRFVDEYRLISVVHRPVVNTEETFKAQADAIILDPYRAQLAIQLGFDKDSSVVADIAKRREQFQVERLYRDSVESRVQITTEQRRRYYEKNKAGFITYPAVRYAAYPAANQSAADSLMARLKAGERLDAIIRADSVRDGKSPGIVRLERENDHNAFHKLIFEELKPGQAQVLDPEIANGWFVVQSLSFDPGHQLSFAEAQGIADDNLRAEGEEKMLNQLIARHRKKHTIVTHPELVMRIRLVDPTVIAP